MNTPAQLTLTGSPRTKREFDARNSAIVAMRAAGATLRAVSEAFSLSAERVRHICNVYARAEEDRAARMAVSNVPWRVARLKRRKELAAHQADAIIREELARQLVKRCRWRILVRVQYLGRDVATLIRIGRVHLKTAHWLIDEAKSAASYARAAASTSNSRSMEHRASHIDRISILTARYLQLVNEPATVFAAHPTDVQLIDCFAYAKRSLPL